MSLSKKKTIYGIHEIVPYHRGTGIPYGSLKIIGNSTIMLTGELIKLTGGSSPFIWDSQDGNMTSEIALTIKESPPFVFKLFLGKDPTETLSDPGSVTTLTNIQGTSLQDATTGIASVGVKSGSESDMKFGKYIVKVVSATTVDVYSLTDVDFFRGTDKEYIDDSLKITSAPLTITTGVPVEIPGFGVELTGGSGTIGMTVDDTAKFDADPPSDFKMRVKIGETGLCIPEFGAMVTAQKKSDGSMWRFDCYRIKAQGFPIGMAEKAFNEAEITGDLIYDSTENGVFEAVYIEPEAGCS